MALYKDHPLQDPDSIRVLKLFPGDSDAAIEVSATTVRLSAQPNFIALSYTWGNPVDERHPSYREYDNVEYHISCAGEPLAVYQNLYEALWQLREKQEYSLLWIDAICIDQRNIEERNHQLSLMPRIYYGASSVIIWLGKDDVSTPEAVEILNNLQYQGALLTQSMMRYVATTSFLDSIPHGKKHALQLLFRRRWFDRVWTLQEVLLPQRTRCLCGPYELNIADASQFAAHLLKVMLSGLAASETWRVPDLLPICGFGSRAFLRFPKIDRKLEIPGSFKWLVALELFVHESRQRNCCKLEDKVLAPLAFALHDQFAPETPDYLPLKTEARSLIDCRISVIELYRKFTHFMIDSMANLDILSRAHRDVPHDDATKELNLPSWVPPFQKPGTTSLIDDLLFTQYNAADHLGPYCRVEIPTKALELPARAVFFGRIVQISAHTAPADNTCAWLAHVRNSERYKQEIESGDHHDLAQVVIRNVGERLDLGLKVVAKRREYHEKPCGGYSASTYMAND
ncbi:hypothetical protein VPNG_10355 [Cytospora leucostoma]|uniref:Heterokaryon incompatibility domain-containing protein n=1 Tax=Cytospora leucostoma TaxID=1230097 RepID=A0A423VB02_9PEZI|nr:hypothetical protein VPNG_10355 [Cytospora leucostoma]